MALAENGKFMAIHIYPVVAQIFKSIDQSGSPTSTAQLDFPGHVLRFAPLEFEIN